MAGQGESLFNDNEFKVMNYLKKMHKTVDITTNALAMADPKVVKNIPTNTKIIYASVDAGSQAVYDIYRGGNFDTWKQGIANLRTLRPEIPVQVNYLLFQHNLTDIPKMLDFCSRMKCRMSCTFPIIFKKDVSLKHDAYWLSNLTNLIQKYKQYAAFIGVQFLCSSGNIGYRPCVLPWRQPMIGIYGDIYSDFFIYQIRKYCKEYPILWEEWYKDKYKEVPQHQYIMGNILEQSWKSIWNKGYTPFLKELNKQNTTPIPLSNFNNIYTKSDWSIDPKWSFCLYCGRRWGFSY